MPLPSIALPRETVTVGGESVEVRGLSRGEVIALKPAMERVAASDDPPGRDIRALEVALLAHGMDAPRDDAERWYDAAPSSVVAPLVEAISRLSGMTEDEAGRPIGSPSAEH